ncbi:MAG: helix-turn-helix domain-containing protein [Tannerellaceae bacterium]|nr:helix-turn-helix domain-containing protein [Tannerellaceae bacterium]
MKYTEILESLKSALAIRYHERIIYQKKVAGALGISIPTVRRRLSGKTSFSLEEISVICEKLEIPADEIFYNCTRRTKQPLEFLQYDFNGYEQESNQVFDQSIDMFIYASRSAKSKFYTSCNTFPNILNPTFEWLARFAALQWIYFTKGPAAMIPLAAMPLTPQLQERLQNYLLAVRALKKSVCLVNNNVTENYITDIRRFYTLGYINKEEAGHLISDIDGALQLFEKVCTEGRLENEKEMEIYCTDLYFSSDMYIVESDNLNFALFQPNPVNPIVSKSSEICRVMIQWFELWKRSANLISQSGTHIRRQFMDKQYQALEEFKAFIESE